MATSWRTAGIASRGRRLLSAAVAIVIGVAFLTASLALLTTARQGMEDAVAAGVRDADLVLTVDGSGIGTAGYDAASALDEVAGVRGETVVTAERTPDEWVTGASVPTTGTTLVEGEMPDVAGEVVVNTELAEHVGVGEELRLTPVVFDAEEEVVARDQAGVDVVGVADFGDTNPMLSFGPAFAATDATLRQVDPMLTYGSVMVELAEGADEAAAREALADAVPEATVMTGPEAAADRVSMLTGGTDVLGAILLGFGAVALLTAAIVIANTFTITLAQRTGELALLRAVGATTRQVRSLVVLEAVVLGLVASAGGVGAGLLAALGLLVVGRRLGLGIPLPDGLAITPTVLLVPLLVGSVVTLLASLWPAVRATRVSPLAALRPSGPSGERERVGRVRVLLALLLVTGGVAAMVHAATSRDVLVGVAGGVVSFVGVLVAAVLVVPVAVRVLGVLARAAGVPGRLAVDNAVRNPGRAAATSAALIVGVTLITMTSVGAASGQRTALGEIDEEYSVDVVVSAGAQYAEDGTDRVDASAVAPDVLDQVRAAAGVETAHAADTAYLSVGEAGATEAVGIDPSRDGDVLRGSEQLASLVPGTLGLSDAMLGIYGLEPGDRVEVGGAGGSAELEVVPFAMGYSLALHADDLTALGGDAVAEGTVLVRLADDADVGEAMGAVGDVAEEHGLHVEGSAAERAVVTQVLDVLVLVTTALLGVAVLIAVVGIANTLSLSVLERHREHALLRGLGLTRGQMRAMLLVEGILLALVSALVGVLLGLGYAALGVQTVLPDDVPLQLAVPWGRVAVIVGVALLAGVLASVLPARRAVRVSPAEGLAAA
ncbi:MULTISPECIES: ABC transporter permease [unclassified Ornithinimicrobium]|uniref:ABC transporter permease n=1 Tax=unclassified Ornithinimicrobium TaxID=2615080 RepID=UPI00385532BC